MRVAPECSLGMAGSLTAHNARTRVVLSKNRPSTRAVTEPRLAHGTQPPPVPSVQVDSDYLDFEITVGRPSLPALPGLPPVPTGPVAEGTGKGARYVKTVARKSAPDLEPHVVANIDSVLDELLTSELPAQPPPQKTTRELPAEDEADELAARETDELPAQKLPRAETHPPRAEWLGVVLSAPEVGASLVIGTWMRPEFCVTSPITRIVAKDRGVLVQTLNHRYFVKPEGDTYLVVED